MKAMIRPSQISEETPLDRILRAWLKGDLENLRDSDKSILERIEAVDKQRRHGFIVKEKRYSVVDGTKYKHSFKRMYSKKELAEWIKTRFDVSLRQAYTDIDMSERFFLTSIPRDEKEFGKGLYIEYGEEQMARAADAGDHRAAVAYYKVLVTMKGYDKHDSDTFDLTKWQPEETIIVDDPSDLDFPFPKLEEDPEDIKARLLKSFKKGLMNSLTEDAESVEEERDEDA